jgi:hypothetical protein
MFPIPWIPDDGPLSTPGIILPGVGAGSPSRPVSSITPAGATSGAAFNETGSFALAAATTRGFGSWTSMGMALTAS